MLHIFTAANDLFTKSGGSMAPSWIQVDLKMKQISGLLFTVLLLAAGTASAASIEHDEIHLEKMPPRVAHQFVAFHQNLSRHIDRAIETHLDSQGDLVVASMYESPTSLTPLEIEVGQ